MGSAEKPFESISEYLEKENGEMRYLSGNKLLLGELIEDL